MYRHGQGWAGLSAHGAYYVLSVTYHHQPTAHRPRNRIHVQVMTLLTTALVAQRLMGLNQGEAEGNSNTNCMEDMGARTTQANNILIIHTSLISNTNGNRI